MTRLPTARRAAAALLTAGLFAAGAAAQPLPTRPTPAEAIDAARARQKLADQKAEAEVVAAVREADRLARTNPARAAQLLRAAQTNIDLSGAVGGDARATLTAALQAKLAAVEGRPVVGGGAKPDPLAPTAKANQKAVFDAYVAEVKEVRDGVETVKQLQDARRPAEADRVVAALAKKYPNNPTVIGLTQKDGTANNLADYRALTQLQDKRVVAALNSVAKSGIPAAGDVEFPANWRELSERRKKATEVQLTAKEKALIEALDKPVSVAFNGRPLDEALQDLSNQMNESLLIDPRSLTELGIDLKKPVSADARNLSARTVLRQVLGGQGLTFVVKGEAIQVMTVEKARESLVTRVYYLGDIVQGVGPFGGALRWGPVLDYQQTVENVDMIVKSIQSSIDPLSWKEKGGPASVTFHFPSMSLIVRASSEVHATLGSKLK